MAQLRQDYREFVVRNTEVLIVSPEDAPEVVEFWREQAMPMPGLVDPGHEVANQYGQEVKLLQLGRLPSMVVLDRSGAVRFEHRGGSMMDIPPNQKILALLDELNREWDGETVKAQAKA
jgi:thioredoxin-dependent peroxiredoxin